MDSLTKYEPTKHHYIKCDFFGLLSLSLSKRPDKKLTIRPSTSKSRFFDIKTNQNFKIQASKMPSLARLKQNSIQPWENFHAKSETETIKLGPLELGGFTIKKRKNTRKPSKKTSESLQENIKSIKISFDVEENDEILDYLSKNTTRNESEDLKTHYKSSSMPLKSHSITGLIMENQISAFSSQMCQTDFKTSDLKHIENNYDIKGMNDKNLCSNKALVTVYSIDISFKEYQVRYSINSTLDIIFIDVSSYNEKYDMQYNTKPESPILEVIKDKIHPCIDIVDKKLVIRDCEKKFIVTGMHISKMIKYKVCVESTAPRYEFVFTCEIMGKCIKKTLPYSEIPQEYRTSHIDPELLFTSLRLKENAISIEFPQKKDLQIIYYKPYTFNNQLYHLKISEFPLKNTRFFLFQALSKASNPVGYLLISTHNISEITNIQGDNLLERIGKIAMLLAVKNSQIIIRSYIETMKDENYFLEDEDLDDLEKKAVKIQRLFRVFMANKHSRLKMSNDSEEVKNEIGLDKHKTFK